MHFNACRNIRVDGVTGIQTGDDALAFVTYYSEKETGEPGTVFSFPGLGAWNNSDAVAGRIRAIGGHANGIRISGALGVKISDVEVCGKTGCGIIIDAGRISRINLWQYLASRDIEISDVRVKNCNTGLYIMQFDPVSENPDFGKFGVSCRDFRIENSDNDSVHLSGVSGIGLAGFRTSGCRWRFRTVADCRLREAEVDDGDFLMIGRDQAPEPFSLEQLHDCSTRIAGLKIRGGSLIIQRCRNLGIRDLEITGSAGTAVAVLQTLESVFSDFMLGNMNKSGATPFAIQIRQSRALRFDKINVVPERPLTAVFNLEGEGGVCSADSIFVENVKLPSGSQLFFRKE